MGNESWKTLFNIKKNTSPINSYLIHNATCIRSFDLDGDSKIKREQIFSNGFWTKTLKVKWYKRVKFMLILTYYTVQAQLLSIRAVWYSIYLLFHIGCLQCSKFSCYWWSFMPVGTEDVIKFFPLNNLKNSCRKTITKHISISFGSDAMPVQSIC